tara:strand:- start:291 stop:473 length:183 start_codon:yes stop_codon:yes gene_type:complete
MEQFAQIFYIVIAIYLTVGGLIINAESNWQSKFTFKVVPVVLGLSAGLLALNSFGLIIQV